ncbi:MAG: hypothetical protein A2Y62_21885 [Candidatus Fischerbacteria bacterium RBG_13_37_8]|uniref:Glutamyl-tRNA amidotransferase n=1 Tax=Candidatus Fischerbacteria bacterium RBG_13_37_8 TaxID=1817863 RepID=A0A1F5VU61_9BACT|nr:MAG: hypothetical protein A2Y62_21885 [Candidatus Fischerbacteria bacterium RBG_13_37_8]
MSIKETIEQDFVKAMKEKNTLKVSTLRMVKAAIKNSEIDKIGKLDDAEVVKLLDNLVKKRQESILLFREGEREDLATKEENEIKIIESYLPKAISNEDILSIADKIITEIQAEGPKDFGKVMKAIMEALKTERVDGKLVSSLVKEKLERLQQQ